MPTTEPIVTYRVRAKNRGGNLRYITTITVPLSFLPKALPALRTKLRAGEKLQLRVSRREN